MIEVRGLCKYYGNHKAINDVSFNIQEGEIVGLLGLNGAGKSTILKVLATFLAPTDGDITMGGYNYQTDIDKLRRMIGYLPDTPPLYDEMRVEDYLRFVGLLKGLNKSDIDKHVDRSIGSTNLQEVRRVALGHLSHGFRQRVGIAQAIIHEPKILILDEPINGLDPVQIVDMRDLILSLRGRYTVILSSHILSEITQTCDQILIIDKGKLVAEGNESQLHKDSQAKMTVKLGWRGDQKLVKDGISQVQGVENCTVKAANGGWEANVVTEGDLRGLIAQAVVSSGGELISLAREDGDLEALFMKLVSGGGDQHG